MIKMTVTVNHGSWHSSDECQDRCHTAETENCSAAVLCDGAGFSEYGGDAAEITAKCLSEYLVEHFAACLFLAADDVIRRVAALIDRTLEKYAKEKGIREELLATTIMAAAMDKKGRFVAFHLGDGRMFWEKEFDGRNLTLSSPENGASKAETWLTMNCSLFVHLRYIRWTSGGTKSITMMTDGMDALSEKNQFDLIDGKIISEEAVPYDDYSAVKIERFLEEPL